MADAVIGAAVEVALSKAISILEDQINLAWYFKDDLNKLRSSLALTRAFLQDAERRQLVEPVKLWLEQLNDIACKADDVLDELAYEHLRRKVDGQMSKKATELGLQQRVQVSAPVSRGVGGGTHSLVDSSRVVGREADVRKVVDLLIGSTTHQTLSIASIVGMGGLGKTTLAKSICNNGKVHNHFKTIIWVCVAENFDVRRILVEMLESLTRKPCEIKNEDAVIREIQKELREKNFLLVLDDVWDEDIKNWEDLKSSLRGIIESKQSWILATSRSESVALVRETPPDHRHHLNGVEDEECWSIIKERAFGNSPLSPDLEAIGRDIARRCGGVPLVATIIGGTLCNKWDRDEWQQQNMFDGVKLWHSLFLNSGSSFHMVTDFKGLRVLKLVGIVRESLSDSVGKLKHLRYFDISKTHIERLPKSITRLYLLETLRLLGCLRLEQLPGGTKSLVNLRHLYINNGRHVPMEIGCLTNLQTLPLFKVGTERGRGIGELGFLVELGGELEILCLENVRDKEEARGARLWEKKKLHKLRYRWGFWRQGCRKDEEVLEGLEPHSNLKSLTIDYYKGECYPPWLVRKASGDPSACFQPMNLVELKLFRCENVQNLPPLGQYPNLRFLEIEGLKSVRCIGKEFYMNGCDENKPLILFPALEVFTLKKMRELKEWLDVEPAIPVFPSLKVLEINFCDDLNSVPRMSRFSSLEELTVFYCSKLGWMGDEPFSSRLKRLIIKCCTNLRSVPTLDGLSSLLELELCGCEGLTSLPSGLSTCTSLRRLLIDYCINLESVPKDVGQLHSLEELCIVFCGSLKRLLEESLGCLTRLKRLRLGPFSKEVEEFPGLGSIHHLHSSLKELTLSSFGWDKPFSLPFQLQHLTALERLDILEFDGLKALPEWLGNLSSLRILCLEGCGNLVDLPSREALQRLSNLHLFRIYRCPRLEENNRELSKVPCTVNFDYF
ncbi:hypothetical protein V6N11_048986 [Hibiscus sabdariffa]|uniref:Disease resistance protein RGA3 n=1 Tax=Hibiscus sabdariffa TaxID=183260 RepID=A0ABR2PXG5_9ROSI